MPITSTDIVVRLSTTAGSAGDTTAQANPNNSLGKYVSTTVMGAGANTLFDNVTGTENAASTVDYRCVFVLNNHATLTLQNAVVYMTDVAGGANVAIAVDNIAASAKGSASAQAATIASETTAPSGVGAFSSPTTAGTGLALGNLAPGQVRGVWVRRSATNSAALSSDGFTLNVTGDTDA